MPRKSHARLQLRITSDEETTVEKIRRSLNAPSNIAAIRKALRIGDWYVSVIEKGYSIVIEKNGKSKTVELIL